MTEEKNRFKTHEKGEFVLSTDYEDYSERTLWGEGDYE